MTKSPTARARCTRKRTRIQRANETRIIHAALEAFSTFGYRGTTIDVIAERAGMSKPNLLYYFARKEDLYRAVLTQTLEMWLTPLAALNPAGDPIVEIHRYIQAKLAMSRERPEASRVFANEILHGATTIADFLSGPLRALVDEKATVIRRWIANGHLAPVEPRHLIMMIWAVTQHYADFDVQVRAVLGKHRSTDPIRDAEATIFTTFLEGLRPR